jgi:hypothetical protein
LVKTTLKDHLYSNMCKHDKIYVELNDSTERSDLSCIEIQKMIETCNIPINSMLCTMCIEKKSYNYKRTRKFFNKLFNEISKNEN